MSTKTDPRHGDPKDRWIFATDAEHAICAHAQPTPGADKDDIYKPEVMKTIEDEIDSFNAALRDINLKIHGASSYQRCGRQLTRIIWATHR